MTGYAITKDARRATRIVVGDHLAWLKRMGNRRARRARRVHDRRLLTDIDTVGHPPCPFTGWDVA